MLGVCLTFEVCLNFCMPTGANGNLELSAVDRENIESMLADHGMITDDGSMPYVLAPGDEGFDLSHEGGEYEALQGLSRTMADLSGL